MGKIPGLNTAASRVSRGTHMGNFASLGCGEVEDHIRGCSCCVYLWCWVGAFPDGYTLMWFLILFSYTHKHPHTYPHPHTHTHPRTHLRIYQGGRGLLALKGRRQINFGHQEPGETYRQNVSVCCHMSLYFSICFNISPHVSIYVYMS